MNTILFIALIILLIIIIYCYYYFKTPEIDCHIEQLNLTNNKEKMEKCYEIYSSQLTINKNNCFVFTGVIPEEYKYWTVGIYKLDGTPIRSICMGDYPAFYPNSTFAVLISSNKCVIKETKKRMEQLHYKKYKYRRILFNKLNIDEDEIIIHCKCYVDNPQIPISRFILYDYQYKNINYIHDKYICEKIKYNSINDIKVNIEHFKNHKEIQVFNDVPLNFMPSECLNNISELIKLDNNELTIITYEQRISHSQICIYSEDENKIIDIYYTCYNINTSHVTKIKNIKGNIRIIENMFFDLETKQKPINVNSMKIFMK